MPGLRPYPSRRRLAGSVIDSRLATIPFIFPVSPVARDRFGMRFPGVLPSQATGLTTVSQED